MQSHNATQAHIYFFSCSWCYLLTAFGWSVILPLMFCHGWLWLLWVIHSKWPKKILWMHVVPLRVEKHRYFTWAGSILWVVHLCPWVYKFSYIQLKKPFVISFDETFVLLYIFNIMIWNCFLKKINLIIEFFHSLISSLTKFPTDQPLQNWAEAQLFDLGQNRKWIKLSKYPVELEWYKNVTSSNWLS